MLEISEKVYNLKKQIDKDIKLELDKVDEIIFKNSQKVLNAFIEEQVSETDFNMTTGYGYGDIGREKIEKVYANIFHAEAALVRNQFISGSHALTVCLFALLRPNDTLLSITGKPYDTLDEVIGIKDNPSSLKSFSINYEQIDLVNNEFDEKKIIERLSASFVKVVEIQRSKGYSTRKSMSIEQIEKIIKTIKNVSSNTTIMIDNCYCEFVSTKEPTDVGADVVVGSLIKNLGGAIASNGAYIVGKKKLINLCAERLNLPGEGIDVGPSLGANKSILQGLYLSLNAVSASLKTAIFTSRLFELLGYNVEPKYNDERVDIVQNIYFGNEEDMINYATGIQKSSPIDSNAVVEKSDMPGYADKIIMASGSFTQGSSIELSCDGPIRSPYIIYQQGSLSYEYGLLSIMSAVTYFLSKRD